MPCLCIRYLLPRLIGVSALDAIEDGPFRYPLKGEYEPTETSNLRPTRLELLVQG